MEISLKTNARAKSAHSTVAARVFPSGGPLTCQRNRERPPRSQLYGFLKNALTTHNGTLVPFRPTQGKVNAVLDALEAGVYQPEEKEPPFWIGAAVEEGTVDPSTLIACRNGLLNIEIREPIPHSPLLLNVNSLPFDYDPDAPEPESGWNFSCRSGRKMRRPSARCSRYLGCC